MFQIVLNGQKIRATEFKYPCFIHGLQGSGASQFTISLASNLVKLDREVIFFSAFSEGKANLLNQLGKISSEVTIPESGNEDEFVEALDKTNENSFIVVKNIEEYSRQVIDKVINFENLILSGDFDSFKHTDILPEAQTHIVFSAVNLPNFPQDLPKLDKYEGFLVNNNLSGKVSLVVDGGE